MIPYSPHRTGNEEVDWNLDLIKRATDSIIAGTADNSATALAAIATLTATVATLSAIVADGDKGDIIISGSGTVWSVDTAYSRARLEDAKAMASLHP
jgi:hypothetical protein